MRYFDLGEHLINDPATTTQTRIPKLGAQWKVIHEFNPTEYPIPDYVDPYGPLVAVWVKIADECYSLAFSSDGVQLSFEEKIYDDTLEQDIPMTQDLATTEPGQLPPIGEWTRIEMTHAVDEETGRYSISVSIAGVEVMKKVRFVDREAVDMDATIGLGDPDSREMSMPGVVRGLVVLEKS